MHNKVEVRILYVSRTVGFGLRFSSARLWFCSTRNYSFLSCVLLGNEDWREYEAKEARSGEDLHENETLYVHAYVQKYLSRWCAARS